MSEELKPCPFCGEPFEFGDALSGWTIVHNSFDCPMESQGANGWIWQTRELLSVAVNTRPLEDALIAERDTLRIEVSEIQHGFELQHKAAINFMDERDALRKQLESVNNENAYLHKQLEIARAALEVSHDAILALPEDAMGVGEMDWNGEPYKYPIRDAVIDEINKALAKINAITNEDGHIAKNDGGAG